MKEVTKKLSRFEGMKVIMLRCPICGFMIKKSSLKKYNRIELELFENMIERINNNELNYFNSCDSDK